MFQSHLDFAHGLWQQVLGAGDLAVDATCGNGHDTVILADLVEESGCVIGFDVQEAALAKTRELLGERVDRVELHLESHSRLEAVLAGRAPKLLVYNLGYLPGGDKSMTTQLETTLESVSQAAELVQLGGLISITCYPGHPEGAREEDALLQWSKELAAESFACTHLRWSNRRRAPSLLLIQRAL